MYTLECEFTRIYPNALGPKEKEFMRLSLEQVSEDPLNQNA